MCRQKRLRPKSPEIKESNLNKRDAKFFFFFFSLPFWAKKTNLWPSVYKVSVQRTIIEPRRIFYCTKLSTETNPRVHQPSVRLMLWNYKSHKGGTDSWKKKKRSRENCGRSSLLIYDVKLPLIGSTHYRFSTSQWIVDRIDWWFSIHGNHTISLACKKKKWILDVTRR